MIIVKLKGGVGNQMFQYAFGRSMQLLKNQHLFFEKSYFMAKNARPYYLDRFNIIDSQILPPKIETIFNERSLLFDGVVYKMPNNTYFNGYWQTELYFKDFRDKIISEFTLKESLPPSRLRYLEIIKTCESASIHIRRGDYFSEIKSKQVHGINLEKYFYQAVSRLKRDLGNKVKLFIFSDDLDWVQNNLNFDLECQYIFSAKDASDYHDLILMSNCRHNIIANSTFSWWGAYLNKNPNPIIIAPDKWFNDDRTEEIVPKKWTKVQIN